MKASADLEADAYLNPTHLFSLINNGDSTSSIVQHSLKSPEEVQTWIVGRKESKKKCKSSAEMNEGRDDGGANRNCIENKNKEADDVMWRYLPIHLVCLQQHPRKELLLVMRDVFPKGLKMRDHHGNLPIHYLLSEGCDDVQLLDIALDEEYKCLNKKDGDGRHLLDIIAQSKASNECKKIMKRWFQKRDKQCTLLSPQRTNNHNTSNYSHIRTPPHNDTYNDARADTDKDRARELAKTKKKLKDVLERVEKLRWECDAKDQKIDSMAAQMTSLEKKIKQSKVSNAVLDNFDKATIIPVQSSTAACDSTNEKKNKEIYTLKAQMLVDAKIVSDQEDEIKRLKKELDTVSKEKTEANVRSERVQKKMDLFDEKILQHDDIVAHVRKVSNILQEDLNAKENELVALQKELDSKNVENEDLKDQIVSKERQAEEKLESFQLNVREQSDALSELLQSLKDKEKENKARIQNDLATMRDQLSAKDARILSLERQIGDANRDRAEMDRLKMALSSKDEDIQSLERQLGGALEKNANLTNMLADKDRQMNMNLETFRMHMKKQDSLASNLDGSWKSDTSGGSLGTSSREMYAVKETDNSVVRKQVLAPRKSIDEEKNADEFDQCSSASAIEIRKTQSRLQNELKDIYAQIRGIMPHQSQASLIENDSDSIEDLKGGVLKEKHSSRANTGTQDNYERRTWSRENNVSEEEVYNVEGWGKRRSEQSDSSIYNI